MTYFKAADNPRTDGCHEECRAVAQGGFVCHEFPGDHFSVLEEPNAGPLARRLQECLHQATRPDSHRTGVQSAQTKLGTIT